MFFIFLGFVFGLCLGSFLNVLEWRLKTRKNFFLAHSVCPYCLKKIKWYDNIPLISFIFLRGRCRFCQQKISWQYPLVELITGLLFSLSVYYVGWQVDLFKWWLIIFVAEFIFIYDWKYLEVNDLVVLSLSLVLFIWQVLSGQKILNLALAVLIGVGFFAFQYFISKGQWIGGGDLRIGLFMAVSLGYPQIILALFLSYIIGAIISSMLLLFKIKNIKDQLPLGVFLSLGLIISLFWGQQILNWYLKLVYD